MDVKKSPKADIQRYSSLFFLVGLIVALGICLFAFNWKTQYKLDSEITQDMGPVVEQEEIPITQQEERKQEPVAPPEAPKIVSKIRLVDREVKIDSDFNPFDTEFDESAAVDVYDYVESSAGEEEEVEEEQVIYFAEEMPSFQGGDLNKFRDYVQKNTKYPEAAAEMGIQGRVRVSFVVEKDGRVSNVKVISGVDPLLDREAVRVVQSSPRWEPGKQRGKPARVGYNIPVVFYLQ